jgi:lipid-A-disaccharide synthase
MARRIMVIAGDPSGDMHAAAVLKALKALDPMVQCYGIGGPAMQKEGFEPLFAFEPFNRMGFAEVVRGLPFFLKVKKSLCDLFDKKPPDALLLVDYPGFNLKILQEAAQRGIAAVWYIAPKVWAWKAQRAAIVGTHARAIATIFPFENRYFDSFGAAVHFVGNPLVEALEQQPAPPPKPADHTPSHIALVPGSRVQEVRRMLQPMLQAFALLRKKHPHLRARVSRCSWLAPALFEAVSSQEGVELFEGPLEELYGWSDAAFITSGTATLEAALRGIPQVIVYRTSALSYMIGRALVHIPFIGLPNIVAQRPLVPEFIQQQASPQRLSQALEEIISSPERYGAMVDALRALRNQLGQHRPSQEVAALLLSHAHNR